MRTTRFALGSFLFVAWFASASMAQAQRTFVSGLGDDGNPCTRTAPCRTFTQALIGTSAGGEVVVLDSAGYGTFTITQSVTVQALPGVYAGVSVFSGNGITINAGEADVVILRGLTVNSVGEPFGSGVFFNAGGTLHIEGCVLNGFPGAGAELPARASGLSGRLEVKDSIMRGNGLGIALSPGLGTVIAAIENVRLEGNHVGLKVSDTAKVVVRNSLAAGGSFGFEASSGNGGVVDLNIENCVASNNSTFGIVAFGDVINMGPVTVRLSNSTVTNNGVGLSVSGPVASFLTRGNNTVEGNTTNTSGTIGSYTAK
jgi:hypothetical protein